MSSEDKKISLSDAITWTTDWRSAPSTSARAFLIPIEDLQGVLAEISGQSGTPKARAYLAMDGTEEKLIFVGTQYNDKTGVYEDLLPAAGENYQTAANSIWDFTNPCPPDCDPNSPLN